MRIFKKFQSSDLSLVAYFYYLGMEFETEVLSDRPPKLVFKFDDKECEKLRDEFNNGSVEVEPKRYFHAIKTIKTIVWEKLGTRKVL